jgi:hypothetical protein
MSPAEYANLDIKVDIWKNKNPYDSFTDDYYEYNQEFNRLFCEAQKNLTREQYCNQYHWNGQEAIKMGGGPCPS